MKNKDIRIERIKGLLLEWEKEAKKKRELATYNPTYWDGQLSILNPTISLLEMLEII